MDCAPITTWVAPAAYTYQVRVEQGSASCADARRVLRGYAVSSTAPAAWTCFRGHSGDSWAAACAKGSTIVRAYGPKRERDPWRIVAARVGMTLFAPAPAPPGLRLVSVRPSKVCGVEAVYRGSGRELVLTEWRRPSCAVLFRTSRPHLMLVRGGVQILLLGQGISMPSLQALATSLRPVLV